MARTDLTERERRISLAEEFIMRLEGIQADLREDLNLIIEYEKIDAFIEHYQDYIKKQKLNSEKADKTCATKHVIPPKSKDSGILPNFT